jgi:hypothetical protein
VEQEEEGEEGQEAENDVPDGMEVLTPEKLATVKSRLDGKKIRTKQQLAKFHKLMDDMIYQRKKRGVGDNFFCRVGNCMMSKGTRQNMRDHIEAKHLNRVEHPCDKCHGPQKTSASLSQHLRKIHC